MSSPSPPIPVGIFWDTKSCSIPFGVDPAKLVDNIKLGLRHHFPDFTLEGFFIYKDADAGLPPLHGPNIHDLPCHPSSSYRLYPQMLCDVLNFALPYASRRRAVIIVISCDKNLKRLSLVLLQHCFRVVLVAPSTHPVSSYFCRSRWILVLDWLSLAHGSGEVITPNKPSPVAHADDEKAVTMA